MAQTPVNQTTTLPEILTAWGKVYSGSLIGRDPISIAKSLSGMHRSHVVLLLAETEMYDYVCATIGYPRAKAVLADQYAGVPFRFQEPGESTLRALVRNGWLSGSEAVLKTFGYPTDCFYDFPELVRLEFEAVLIRRIESDKPIFADRMSHLDEIDLDQGPVTAAEKCQSFLLNSVSAAVSIGDDILVDHLWGLLRRARQGEDVSKFCGFQRNPHIKEKSHVKC